MSSMRRPRRGMTAAAVPLIIAVAVAGATWVSWPSYASKWDEGHDPRESFNRERPECPQHWGSVPLFFDSTEVKKLRELTSRQKANGVVIAGDTAAFVPDGDWRMGVPSGPIANVAGPNTDIPEFHDCNKFLRQDQTRYDSLFAIFASFRLDSVTSALWDSVTWTSSDQGKATVSTSGVVTAVAPGAVTISARSTREPDRTTALAVTVVPSVSPPPPPPQRGVTTSIGHFSLGVGQSIRIVSDLGPPTVTTHAAATIYTYGPGYPSLGIGRNFNCLYLYLDSTSTLHAKVVPVGGVNMAAGCLTAKDPKSEPGTELDVKRIPGGKSHQQAPVARWDWDSKHKQQYIGIMCGDAWCEIGPLSSSSTPPSTGFTRSPGHLAAPSATTEVARVIENKGWNDEQNLAMISTIDDPGRPGKKLLVPSGIIGTVIPDPALARKDRTSYDTEKYPAASTASAPPDPWVQVAYIALDTTHAAPGAVEYYWDSLHVRPAPVSSDLNSMNRLAFCFGTREHCQLPDSDGPQAAKCGPIKSFNGWWENDWFGTRIQRMWVRVTSPRPGDMPYYRCVIRRGHLGVKASIAATARWRWLLGDDTTWTECASGCCEYRPGDN